MMGNAAQTGFPSAVYNAYRLAALVLLALVGLAIAVASALALGGADAHRARAARNNPCTRALTRSPGASPVRGPGTWSGIQARGDRPF